MNDNPTPGPARIRLTDAQLKSRRARSLAIAWSLGIFAILILLVTIVRLGPGILNRPM